jgi:hypothetical protein
VEAYSVKHLLNKLKDRRLYLEPLQSQLVVSLGREVLKYRLHLLSQLGEVYLELAQLKQHLLEVHQFLEEQHNQQPRHSRSLAPNHLNHNKHYLVKLNLNNNNN